MNLLHFSLSKVRTIFYAALLFTFAVSCLPILEDNNDDPAITISGGTTGDEESISSTD